MTEPKTMRAAILDAHCTPFHLASVSRPAVGPGQVLVRIHAACVNPLDIKIHEGKAATPAIRCLRSLGSTWPVRWRPWALV
jgi:NADPH:quinone reductase